MSNENQNQTVDQKGLSKSSSNPGNFKNNPQKAAEAGRKGGQARRKSTNAAQ